MRRDGDLDQPVTGPDEARQVGSLAWTSIVAGWLLMGWAVLGMLRDDDRSHPGSWAAWVVGAALVHDLLVVPVVLLVGLVLSHVIGPSLRTPLRAGLTVASIVAVATWPTVARYGARSDNPSLLPLPTVRNLTAIVVLVLCGTVSVGLIRSRRPGARR